MIIEARSFTDNRFTRFHMPVNTARELEYGTRFFRGNFEVLFHMELLSVTQYIPGPVERRKQERHVLSDWHKDKAVGMMVERTFNRVKWERGL